MHSRPGASALGLIFVDNIRIIAYTIPVSSDWASGLK
nr:MAG TPA: sugar-binding protein GENOMICS, JOINT CENTER FOR [Caudoviricetes sp.]